MVAALLMAIAASPSTTLADEGKRIAFVVGINKYEKLGKNLERAVNDAREVSRTLRKIGFQVTEGVDVTTSEFDAKWQSVLNSLTKEDTFVLFFSGHGVEVDGENLLLPRDIPYFKYGRHQLFKRQAVSVSELMNDLRTGDRQHPKVTVMILDACRENPTIPPEYRTKGGKSKGGLAEVKKTGGSFILYAAAPGTVSLDSLGPDDTDANSVYTRSLLPLLNQTDLSIRDLAVKVRERVYALTETEQVPEYTDGLIGQFCLAGCVANVATGRHEPEPMQPVQRQLEPPIQAQSPSWLEAMRQNFPFPKVPPTEKLPSTATGKDGAPMVLIPTGTFQMGSTKDEVERAIQTCENEYEQDQQTCEGWFKGELPRHQVSLDAFYFDKYEVTNRLFQRFVQETGYRTTAEEKDSAWAFVEGNGWEDIKGANWRKPEASTSVFQTNRAEHPVVAVSWDDAVAFCSWAGKRLPTEAEWEYAARAGTTTQYWLGQGNPGARRVENIADESAKHLFNVIMSGYNDGAVRTAPVGSYETNPWGLYDIGGNVSEWTADWYDEGYYGKSPERNPKGPSNGQYRVLRGGSWDFGPVHFRSAYRDGFTPTSRDGNIGFRCAQDIPK